MKRAVVLDASAIVRFILNAAGSPNVIEIVGDQDCHIAVPHVCDLEVVSAPRSRVRRQETGVDRALSALDLYEEMPLQRVDQVPFLRRIFTLRDNFSPYDGAYVALAEALQAPLFTADARLAAAVRRFTAVEVVEV